MLQLSESAAEALQEARDQQDIPEEYGIRVSAQAGPEGQTGVAVGFAEHRAEGDEVSEQAGTVLYVSDEVAEPLAESVIDVADTPQGTQLVIRSQDE